MKLAAISFLFLALVFCTANNAFAQSATPSTDSTLTPTDTPSPTLALTNTPSISTSPTAAATTGTAANSSVSVAPTPTATNKQAVLGAATRLGSTGNDRDITKWVMSGTSAFLLFFFGFILTRAHGQDE